VDLSIVQDLRRSRAPGNGTGGTAAADANATTPPGATEFLWALDAPGATVYEWRLRITGEEPLATLTCGGLERLPAGWQVNLLDPAAGTAVDFLRAGSHRFVLGGEREFVIRVGDRPPDGFSWSPARTGITRLTPNPASGPVTVEYTLAQAARVRIDIFDVMGRRVSSFNEGARDAGRYFLAWGAAQGVPPMAGAAGPGVYFVRLQADDLVDRRKLVLLR
jgi:hypothetical protein